MIPLRSVRRDVEIGDESVLDAWKTVLYSCTIVFKAIECEEDWRLAHLQLKESPGVEFDIVRHSALSRLLDVVAFARRHHMNTSDAEALAKQYAGNLTLAESSERITKNLVTCALEVHDRLLTRSELCMQLLLRLDQMGSKNPLDSITKLHILSTSAGSGTTAVAKQEWLLSMLCDGIDHGVYGSDECTIPSLRGRGEGAGRKGTADIILAKQELLQWLLGFCTKNMPSNVSDKLREMTKSVASWREAMGGGKGSQHIRVLKCCHHG
eukprot:2353286-Amphidinium_carterae.1